MSFVVPQFPITCNIWRDPTQGGANLYLAPEMVAVPCNLTPGRRVEILRTLTPQSVPRIWTAILLPALTDIRGAFNGLGPDYVECPAGSQVFYFVFWIVDIGKGFANEHRMAVLEMNQAATVRFADVVNIPFPVPMP